MENKFSSKQVAEITGLSVHTLRYYEQIGLIGGIERDGNGYRLYSQADIVWFNALHYFRAMGMPVREIQKIMAMNKGGVSTITARREFIESYRETVIEQRKELDLRLEKVDQKIDFFRRLESTQLELDR
ncbi:MerR family transcriptional regulator [Paenibacillus sp. sgz5001063]|uniref:MerR family transcriptional regulator n=1 Tax=Paenibacillus sp. sgz5001063 TaxID=3242474 RepID=UPI0036D42E00